MDQAVVHFRNAAARENRDCGHDRLTLQSLRAVSRRDDYGVG